MLARSGCRQGEKQLAALIAQAPSQVGRGGDAQGASGHAAVRGRRDPGGNLLRQSMFPINYTSVL